MGRATRNKCAKASFEADRPPRGKAKYFGRARRAAPVPTDRRLIVGVERFFVTNSWPVFMAMSMAGDCPATRFVRLLAAFVRLGCHAMCRHSAPPLDSRGGSRRFRLGRPENLSTRRGAGQRARSLSTTSPPDICVRAKWPRRTAAAGLHDESGRMPPALPRATRQRVSHGQQNAYRRLPPGGNSGGGATR